MSEGKNPLASARDPWEGYWERAEENPYDSAVLGEGSREAFQSVWDGFFDHVRIPQGKALRVLDLACGAGVVTKQARAAIARSVAADAIYVGADYSVAAANRFFAPFKGTARDVFAVVADGACLPFANGAFDFVVSQFGLEYAGLDAFAEASRLLAGNGNIMCVAHYKDGAIERECLESLRIAEEIFASKVFEKVQIFFETEGDSDAEQALAHALQKLQSIVKASPPSPGLKLLSQLGADLTRFAMRRAAFEPREIYTWLEAAKSELSQYSARMRAMAGAALNEGDVRGILDAWKVGGLEVEAPSQIMIKVAAEPSAWQLLAHRPKA